MLLAVSAASVSAQTYQIRKDSVKTGEYSPTVYLVSVNAPQPPADEEALLEAAVLNQLAIDNAIRDYIETHHPGFQQDELPHFIFATKQNKFSFSLGGQVTLRASYDFDGISGAQDFIPATIAVPGTYATRQKFGLDGTTSRIFLKAIANSKKLGRVTLYFSTDFRGGGTNSYTPRIRSAYVSFKGFTFGRDVTTFCDLNAAPNTIDFQGPNAYNYFFSTMIRYEHSIYRDILKFGVAAELPNVSGTYGDSFASIPQRVPDFPVYMQVNWGRNKESHFRASAVFRDMYLHNEYFALRLGRPGQRKYQSSGSPATLLQRCVRRGHHSLHPRFIGHRTGFYTQSSQSEEYSDYADVRLAGGCANRPRSEQTRHFGRLFHGGGLPQERGLCR